MWLNLAAAALVAAAHVLDGTYRNDRFGFVVRYPKAHLVPQPEADNGDGRAFRQRGGRGIVLAYGSFMPEDQTDLMRAIEREAGGKITYRVVRANWFVLSGHRAKGQDFYHKAVRETGAWWNLVFTYDKAAAPTFRPLIEAMAPRFPR